MNSGIDLQGSFVQTLQDFGLPIGLAKAVWLPLPMLLMIIGATVGVLVVVWLERKISAAAQQRSWARICRTVGSIAASCRWY